MAERFWLCHRCVLLHKEGEECPKANEDTGTDDSKPSAPALLNRTSDSTLRPDEQNIVKEMKLSLQAEERAGKLTPKEKEYWKKHVEKLERKNGDRSTFLKHTEIPFGIPADLRKSVRVGFTGKEKK